MVLQIRELEDENARLRSENRELLEQVDGQKTGQSVALTKIRDFQVGIAAAEASLEEEAFRGLLDEALGGAAQESTFRITREDDSREVEKIRGMLVQQYLAAQEVPIILTNLSYRLQEPEHEFKVAGTLVPRPDASLAGGLQNHKSPIQGVMHREAENRYSITYEELGGGRGVIPISVRDVDILDADRGPRSTRQGDISFNWDLAMEKVHVYRVEEFRGDVGHFVRSMRYSGAQSSGLDSSVGQYQRLRDLVFLFGYGSYVTGLINQIRTPSYISEVEVFSIDPEVYGRLNGGMSEDELLEALSTSKDRSWIACEFVDFSEREKVWKRPSHVPFPFVSRQQSKEKGLTFYTKYDGEGSHLVGDFESRQ